MLKINDITITKSQVSLHCWVLTIELAQVNGHELKFTGYFEDLSGFFAAVKDAGVFIATRLGKITSKEANERLASRLIAPNPDGSIR